MTGASGATGSTDSTGDSGSSGTSGATGPTAGATSVTGATGPAAATPPVGATSPPAAAGATSTSGTSGTTGTTSPSSAKPVVSSITAQPTTGSALVAPSTGKSGGADVGGAVAPSPSLFSDENPLAGVLPGSVFDPLVNAAIGADVPQWFVQHFDVPSFLLPIYQAAGTAYNVPWEVLAAINQVETNFGSNLNVSSAGAIGWMQFLPSTWQRYGVDATDSDVADPYNAADAIFSAARYLDAAGASTNLPAAIFAYNHSTAYVESVLLRAELLSGVPSTLVNSVSELSEGLFPIELRFHPSYDSVGQGAAPTLLSDGADGSGVAPAPAAVGASVRESAASHKQPAAEIFAASHAAAVAVQDGTVVAIGHSRRLGSFVRLKDSFGNVYTYGNLASVAAYHLVARPAPASQFASLSTPAALSSGPVPTAPATAGSQSTGGIDGAAAAAAAADQLAGQTAQPPTNPAAAPDIASPFAAFDFRPGLTDDVTIFGGPRLGPARQHQMTLRAAVDRAIVDRYFTTAFGLARDQLEARALRVGSHVLAGTILGHLGSVRSGKPHLIFELRPAGAGQAQIDPRPFLDAWSQLATLELHRTSTGTPLYGPDLQGSDAGAALLMSQVDLERVILDNSHLRIAVCERRAIAAGAVDRRVLASIEFLVDSGLDPRIGDGACVTDTTKKGHKLTVTTAALADSVAITAINSVPVAGHQGAGTPTDAAIHALLTLTGDSAPAQIASLETIAGAPVTVADPGDSGQIVIGYTPVPPPLALASSASYTGGFRLGATRWAQLDTHLLSIPEPRVPTVISTVALRTTRHSEKQSKRG